MPLVPIPINSQFTGGDSVAYSWTTSITDGMLLNLCDILTQPEIKCVSSHRKVKCQIAVREILGHYAKVRIVSWDTDKTVLIEGPTRPLKLDWFQIKEGQNLDLRMTGAGKVELVLLVQEE